MQFSTQVDFFCRYGKTIGNSVSGIRSEFTEKLKQIESDKDKRKLFCDSIDNIIKSDLILCVWLYYVEYDKFISELKDYIISLDLEEFNIISHNCVYLGNLIDIFWLESNDPTLKLQYNFDQAKKDYIEKCEKNGYTYKDDPENFKILLKYKTYCNINKDLDNQHFNFKKELSNARFDDILQLRTSDEWKILYSLRYKYKNVINLLNKNKLDDNIDNRTELFYMKTNLENYLMLYQQTSEGLEWHNPYSDKLIESLEYFPRETSKPPYDYAYLKYYDLEKDFQNNIDSMISNRKRHREELKNEFTNRLKKINTLHNEIINKRNNILNTVKYVSYGLLLSGFVGICSVIYMYWNN
jgi:hypothetical protein